MPEKLYFRHTNELRFVESTITRPANTTLYTAGDALSDATGDAHFTFPRVLVGRANTGEIRSAYLIGTARQSTEPDLELYLFHTDIATTADNDNFAPTDAEMATCVAVIEIPSADMRTVGPTGSGGGRAQFMTRVDRLGSRMPFQGVIANGEVALYGQLVVANAYTPVSAEEFTIGLIVRSD